MALTAAERQRKRRQKLKEEGKYEDYKKKNKAEAEKSRTKNKQTVAKFPQLMQAKIKKQSRENVKRRVAKCRALKREKDVPLDPASLPYKNSSALGKATARAKRSLPSTPRRRKAVVRRLFLTEVSDNCPPSTSTTTHTRSTALPTATAQQVHQFYERDDISRQAPGRKDVITVCQEDGSKAKMQTKHLQYSVKEVHRMFSSDYPDVKIGKSSFAKLRPKHVLLSSKLPHNVCLCKYHENFITAVDDLHKYVPNVPKYSTDFAENLLCEKKGTDCWLNKCADCKDGKWFMKEYGSLPEMDISEEITWHMWKTVDSERLCKVVEEGTVNDLLTYICNLIPQFLEHCYVKRAQARTYREQHEAATSDTYPVNLALVQVDFSENFKCVSQDEIQSAHWSQSQISLFTSAVWYSGIIHSGVIVSDNLTHSKETVVAYIDKLLEDIPQEVEEVHIWSDGPTSQFKNKYIAAALPTLQAKHNITIKWNFFATSHGKGPVDGIGGSVKRQVWDSVKRRQHVVYNAAQFVLAAAATSNVRVLEMSQVDIESRYEDLKLSSVFANATTMEGIMRHHFLEVVNGDTVGRQLTNQLEPTIQPQHTNATRLNNDTIEISVGNWFQVEYDGQLYPGEVKDIANNEYLVSVMVRAGKYWKWPAHDDEIYYQRESLIRKIDPPEVINARGYFKFRQLD